MLRCFSGQWSCINFLQYILYIFSCRALQWIAVTVTPVTNDCNIHKPIYWGWGKKRLLWITKQITASFFPSFFPPPCSPLWKVKYCIFCTLWKFDFMGKPFVFICSSRLFVQSQNSTFSVWMIGKEQKSTVKAKGVLDWRQVGINFCK